MKFKAEFTMDNAAFGDNTISCLETADVLRRIAEKVNNVDPGQTDMINYGLVHDSNGNRIGSWEISK